MTFEFCNFMYSITRGVEFAVRIIEENMNYVVCAFVNFVL